MPSGPGCPQQRTVEPKSRAHFLLVAKSDETRTTKIVCSVPPIDGRKAGRIQVWWYTPTAPNDELACMSSSMGFLRVIEAWWAASPWRDQVQRAHAKKADLTMMYGASKKGGLSVCLTNSAVRGRGAIRQEGHWPPQQARSH